MGPSACPPDVYKLARDVGLGIGRAGAILICGGGSGVMEASARGAKEAGGITIGILPGDCADDANAYIDIPIVSGMGNGRNAINVMTSQAVIAIHGSYGTLSEIALALKSRTPVVGLRTWGLVPPGGNRPPIELVRSADEAVAAAIGLIKRARPGAVDRGLRDC